MNARRMRKDAAVLVVLVAATAILPAAAHAGTYDVVSCQTPGADGINRAWTVETYSGPGKAAQAAALFVLPPPADVCSPAIGQTLTTDVSATKSARVDDGAAFTFRAPSGTTVRDVTISRSGTARTGGAAASWTVVAHSGTTAGGPSIIGGTTGPDYCSGGTAPPAFCVTGASGFATAGSSITYASIGQPVVSWGVQCAATTPAAVCLTGDAATPNARFQFQGAKVTVEDLVPPEVGASGPLDGWRRPSEAQSATATDAAGIRTVRVVVDGAERAAQSLPCDYHRPAPCPISASLPYDLAGLADGRHALSTIAEDTAGNVSRTDRTIDLDGTAPGIDLLPAKGRTIAASVSDAGAGVQGGTIEVRNRRDAPFAALKTTLRGGRLTAAVPRAVKVADAGIRVSATDKAGNAVTAVATSMRLNTRVGKHARKVQNARATIRYGRAVSVLGRLSTTDGAPLPDQTIVVTGVLRQTGAAPQPLATARTDARGRFSVALPAGPSRTLSVEYPGAPGLLQRVRGVALRVPAASTIHAATVRLRGAGSVRFSGRLRLLGTAPPPGGKIVELQASQGGHWSTVATTRTGGPDAAWHASAHFRGTAGRFGVRLRIRREAVFPYELGYSPSVVVRVR